MTPQSKRASGSQLPPAGTTSLRASERLPADGATSVRATERLPAAGATSVVQQTGVGQQLRQRTEPLDAHLRAGHAAGGAERARRRVSAPQSPDAGGDEGVPGADRVHHGVGPVGGTGDHRAVRQAGGGAQLTPRTDEHRPAATGHSYQIPDTGQRTQDTGSTIQAARNAARPYVTG